ncbi:MAG: amylosucrase, partial [Clostridia bacterium]|nr:amylosucrase [Clostridia bacterium]
MKEDFTKELEQRLESRCDELKWLYYELYHNDQAGFDYLCGIIQKAYAARDDALKARDRAWGRTSPWYTGHDVVGMMLYVDNFAGNLQGVIQKMDYFTESGVRYLHLMPLLDSPPENSDGGYAVSDFQKVQSRIGTMDDLRELTALCHDRDIACCLDFVMNHTSDEHVWAKAAKAGDASARGHYFFYDNWGIPNEYEKTVPQVFPT